MNGLRNSSSIDFVGIELEGLLLFLFVSEECSGVGHDESSWTM
jgi:hypothetical protein